MEDPAGPLEPSRPGGEQIGILKASQGNDMWRLPVAAVPKLCTCQTLLLPLKAVILTHSGPFVFDCLMSARPYLYASLKNVSLYCIYLGGRVNRMKPHETPTPSLLYVRILEREVVQFHSHCTQYSFIHAYPNTISSLIQSPATPLGNNGNRD